MLRISAWTARAAASGLPAVRTSSALKRSGSGGAMKYIVGPTSVRRSKIRMSATTPTISYCGASPMRAPTGFSPGK